MRLALPKRRIHSGRREGMRLGRPAGVPLWVIAIFAFAVIAGSAAAPFLLRTASAHAALTSVTSNR